MVFGIITGIVFAAVAVAGFVIGINFEKLRPVTIIGGILGVIGFICVPFSFHQVDTGEVATVKEMGQIRYVRTPGTYFDFWLTREYTMYDTKVRSLQIETQAYSQDAQTMTIQMSVHYQIDSSKAVDIATKYGSLEILENRITGKTVQETKDVLTQRGAELIISERNLISQEVANAVETAIGADYFVDIQTVALTNIDFSDAYEKAVEDKMVAEQIKKQKDYENQATEAAAKTAAEVKKLQSEADAVAVEKAAEAEANAIAIKSLEIAKMLGLTEIDAQGQEVIKADIQPQEAKLISDYLRYIEYLSVWDGKLPNVITDSSGNIIVTP